MKTALPFLLIIASCSQTPEKIQPQPDIEKTSPIAAEQEQDIDTVMLGDLNYDKIPDTAMVYAPLPAIDNPLEGEYRECEDDSCVTYVRFSFTQAELQHTQAIGFLHFFATHDLNSDGIKEVAFIPDWFQSCWSALFVYSLQENKWIKLGGASVYACEGENFEGHIRKISSKEFELINEEWNEDFTEIRKVPERIIIQ